MGDYEGVPDGWSWLHAASADDIDALRDAGRRPISVHRRDGEDGQYCAAWVANAGADATGWGFEPRTSGDGLKGAVGDAGGRLICIDAFDSGAGEPELTGVWVDAGSVDWGFDYDMSGSDVRKRAETGRLVSLTTYGSGHERRYAAVWRVDLGPAKRRWDWDPSISFEDLRQRLEDFPGRLVSVDPFVEAGEVRFAAVWVDAGGQQARLWWWTAGQDADEITLDAGLFCSYVVEARSLPGLPDRFVHFRHGFPRSDYEESASLVSLSGTATLNSLGTSALGWDHETQLDLTLTNVSGGDVEITEAQAVPTYHGWYWPPGANYVELFADKGVFAGQPTQMPSAAAYTATRTDSLGTGPPAGVTHYVARARATNAAGERQRVAATIPVVATGAPEFFDASVPVHIGLWANPLEIVPLWLDDKRVNWLTIAGSIVNWTGDTVRLAGLHVTVKTLGGTIVADRELSYDLRQFGVGFRALPPPAQPAHAALPPEASAFVDGIELPASVDTSDGLRVLVVLNYKLPSGWCGAAERNVIAVPRKPQSVASPLPGGTWRWGSAATHQDFDTHAHFFEHWCYDITKWQQRIDAKGNLIWDSSTGQAPTDNNQYFAYKQPVSPLERGEVILCDFSVTTENSGNAKDAPGAANHVVLGHGAGPDFPRRSWYEHLRPANPGIAVGDQVDIGDTIGYLGNSGNSTEPHLHLAYWVVDDTGRPRPHPIVIADKSRLKTLAGAGVSGVPSTGLYEID